MALYFSPFCTLGGINDLNALGLQFITDAVGFRPVFGLLGFGTGSYQGIDLGVGIGGFFLDLLLAKIFRSRASSRTSPS